MNVWFILFEMLSSLLFALFEIVAQYLSLYVPIVPSILFIKLQILSLPFSKVSRKQFLYILCYNF